MTAKQKKLYNLVQKAIDCFNEHESDKKTDQHGLRAEYYYVEGEEFQAS